ncbi:Purine catabolism regulatory protein [Caloramator mitchellensis]|uniref:Purine catabolism regulatory protein n=1 Tax=Caloramator mitchellensis TaxID=908809 RepID=A0A0R3K5F9_CALMK|nr:PucR family transcriptional regulator ligand-binding domain-containing protein [Caloramator mitchellensis]KRQ87599.1 Purine catabolism regulatory protein [Caloramator mitchellensis]
MARQNGITIEDVLNMECMKNCKIIAGHGGLKNTVSRVNIMADMDILNWVSQGELLLTTAYSLTNDLEFQKRFILDCSKKNLAGLGIKIYPYKEKLDDEILKLADEISFPIIELYYSTPFSEIMTPIFKEIFNKQAILLQRVESVHENLMNIMLKGGSIEEILDVVQNNIKNPIVLKLKYPEKVIYKFNDVDEHIKNKLIKNCDDFYNRGISKINERRLHESVEKIDNKNITRMIMPIVVKDSVYGHIFSWAVNTPLGGFDLSVLEISSTTMALEILKLLSLREAENRHRIEFVDDLCSNDNRRREKALSKANVYNLNRDDLYCFASIKLKACNKRLIKESIIDNLYLTYIIEETLEKNNINGIVIGKTDKIDIILSFKNNNYNKKIIEFKDRISEIFSKKIFIDFKIAFGRCYRGIEKLEKSFQESQKALNAINIINYGNTIFYDNMGIYKILCNENIKEEVEDFYFLTIHRLEEYDLKKSTEFVKTLKAYFECNGNLKKMSESLFTHYNTILYRLQRIKEITGMDVEKEEDRLNLQIGLKIMNIISKRE